MAYTIAVSSGLSAIQKPEELLGISKKLEWALTRGVNFVQVDLENITEFREPFLEDKIKRIKKLGVEFGIHGESLATSGGSDVLPLGSALHTDYLISHQRLKENVVGSGKIGARFCTIHTVEAHPFVLLGRDLQSTRLVDFWGRPLKALLEENPSLIDWAINQEFIRDNGHWFDIARRNFQGWTETYVRTHNKMPTEEEQKKAQAETYKEIFKSYYSEDDLAYGPERVAYWLVARYMQMKNDPIWAEIVGRKIEDKDLADLINSHKWVPAVAAKYMWGHLMQDACPKNTLASLEGDVKPILEKYKMYLSFETPMAQHGYEGHVRLARLPHIYSLVKNINSQWVSMTMDMEHMLGCNIDPVEDIKALPSRGGERLKIVHVTTPTPLNPSHVPVPVGSEAQYYIYQRLWELRQKGFLDGWMVFERAGGDDPIKQSVLAMRKIKQYLELNTPPDQLPLDFWGMDQRGWEVQRQEVTIKEHMMDPIKGMLLVPEEEYTFLSKSSSEKGKTQEWGKEKYR